MKLTIPAPLLLAALNLIKPIAKPNTTHVQLGNVYITAEKNNITLLGMDLEKQLTITLPASVTRKGSTTMPCNRLVDFVDGLKGDVSIETNENHQTVARCGRSITHIAGLPTDEFPQQIGAGKGTPLTIATGKFNSLMESSLVHASIDPTRAMLCSVMLIVRKGKIDFNATDGRHAIICSTEMECEPNKDDEGNEMPWIVPRDSISAMTKLATEGELTVKLGADCMSVESEGMEFRTKLLEGRNPRFESAYEHNRELFIVANRTEVDEIVKRATKGTSEQASHIVISCDGDTITARGAKVSAATENEFFDMNQESAKVKEGSATIDFKVNPQYLRDALKCMTKDEVRLEIADSISPIVIQEDGIRCSICPMKLN